MESKQTGHVVTANSDTMSPTAVEMEVGLSNIASRAVA